MTFQSNNHNNKKYSIVLLILELVLNSLFSHFLTLKEFIDDRSKIIFKKHSSSQLLTNTNSDYDNGGGGLQNESIPDNR